MPAMQTADNGSCWVTIKGTHLKIVWMPDFHYMPFARPWTLRCNLEKDAPSQYFAIDPSYEVRYQFQHDDSFVEHRTTFAQQTWLAQWLDTLKRTSWSWLEARTLTLVGNLLGSNGRHLFTLNVSLDEAVVHLLEIWVDEYSHTLHWRQWLGKEAEE